MRSRAKANRGRTAPNRLNSLISESPSFHHAIDLHRAVDTLRAFSAAAIFRNGVAPAAWTSSITGASSAARLTASDPGKDSLQKFTQARRPGAAIESGSAARRGAARAVD